MIKQSKHGIAAWCSFRRRTGPCKCSAQYKIVARQKLPDEPWLRRRNERAQLWLFERRGLMVATGQAGYRTPGTAQQVVQFTAAYAILGRADRCWTWDSSAIRGSSPTLTLKNASPCVFSETMEGDMQRLVRNLRNIVRALWLDTQACGKSSYASLEVPATANSPGSIILHEEEQAAAGLFRHQSADESITRA